MSCLSNCILDMLLLLSKTIIKSDYRSRIKYTTTKTEVNASAWFFFVNIFELILMQGYSHEFR